MNRKTILMGSIIIFGILATSGCLDYFDINGGNTTYESHPTKISYTISYGYKVNCTGNGDYNIEYDCDKPEVLIGTVTITDLLHDLDYSEATLANNNIIGWNISGEDTDNYKLGIIATVEVKSFLVSDLSGTGAETLQGLQTNYLDVIGQYCHKQSNETITFINPENPLIKNTAATVTNKAKSNNSFVLAKELFIWLKQHTNYQIHVGDNSIQPASITIQKKTGDCDDLSFLYISLCRSIGIPARFIRGYLVEENDDKVSVISHAWAEVFVGGELGNYGWIPVECAGDSDTKTEINQNFGVEDVSHLRLFEDDGSDASLNASISGIMVYYTESMKVDMYSFVDVSKYSTLESKELCIDENNNRTYV
ncbi:MAG: transglutaminase domain-containing protein [Thermoplasmatales archaeon]|nr:transglutaminase domain-containing protein [Thermoplasmatales archaeon]